MVRKIGVMRGVREQTLAVPGGEKIDKVCYRQVGFKTFLLVIKY